MPPGLPPTPSKPSHYPHTGVPHGPVDSREQKPRTADPERVAEISRRLSEATPPVTRPLGPVHPGRGGMPENRRSSIEEFRSYSKPAFTGRYGSTGAISSGTPNPGCIETVGSPLSGGVASLNRRLISRNPPGSVCGAPELWVMRSRSEGWGEDKLQTDHAQPASQ